MLQVHLILAPRRLNLANHAPALHQGQGGIPLQDLIILNLDLYFTTWTQGVIMVTSSLTHPLLLPSPVYPTRLVLRCSVVMDPQ
jgi:hypothetical protein